MMFVKLMSKCKTVHNRKEKSKELQFFGSYLFSFNGEEYSCGLNSGHFNSHIILLPLHDVSESSSIHMSVASLAAFQFLTE